MKKTSTWKRRHPPLQTDQMIRNVRMLTMMMTKVSSQKEIKLMLKTKTSMTRKTAALTTMSMNAAPMTKTLMRMRRGARIAPKK